MAGVQYTQGKVEVTLGDQRKDFGIEELGHGVCPHFKSVRLSLPPIWQILRRSMCAAFRELIGPGSRNFREVLNKMVFLALPDAGTAFRHPMVA